jgi:hypothetical protein
VRQFDLVLDQQHPHASLPIAPGCLARGDKAVTAHFTAVSPSPP